MDWPTASVAIAAALGTSAVAIYSLVHQGQNAEKDREHDRAMRVQERRTNAYTALLTALQRQMMQVDRTAPIFVQGGEPPPPPSLADEELWRLNALADILASDQVRELILAWTRKWSEFHNDGWYLGQVQDHQKFHTPSETRENFTVTALEQWQKVEAKRVELRADLRTIGAQVRSEL